MLLPSGAARNARILALQPPTRKRRLSEAKNRNLRIVRERALPPPLVTQNAAGTGLPRLTDGNAQQRRTRNTENETMKRNGTWKSTGSKITAYALVLGLGVVSSAAKALEGPVGEVGALLDSDAAVISFQGVFYNNGGQPMAGNSIDLEFAIYPASGAGAIETVANATYPMADGNVQVLIPVTPSSFDGTGVELGVTVNGGSEMAPRIPLAAVPYAFRVHRVASQELDDDIQLGDEDTAGSLCVFDGTQENPSIVANGQQGTVDLFDGAGNNTLQFDGVSGVGRSDARFDVLTAVPEGSVRSRMGKSSLGGEFRTWDNTNHLTTVVGTKSGGGGGGEVIIGNNPVGGYGHFETATDGTGVIIDGEYNANAGAVIVQKATDNGTEFPQVEIIGDEGDGGSLLNMYDMGQRRVRIDARGSGGGAGINLFNSSDEETITIDADSDDAGEIVLRDRNKYGTMLIDGDDGNSSRIQMGTRGNETLRLNANDGDGFARVTFFGPGDVSPNPEPDSPVIVLNGRGTDGSFITLRDHNVDTVRLLANAGDQGGHISVRSGWDQENVRLDGCGGDDDGVCGGGILVFDGSGFATVEIDGDEAGEGAVMRVGNHDAASGQIRLYQQNQPVSTIHMNGATANMRLGIGNEESGKIFLYSASQASTSIQLNGDTGNTRTKTLTITGGADLAEPFDVASGSTNIEPGMVVSIDPDRPGQLKVCESAYDRTVAGVISGAGGVNPGMVMGQGGSVANGHHPVALTGRVYVYVDATQNPVNVGDLLTTSDTPGHAEKAADHSRAQGAIIGKAMTSLEGGQGLVLVLVSLQ